MANKIKVLIVDNSALWSRILTDMVDSQLDMETKANLKEDKKMFEYLESNNIDVLIMTINPNVSNANSFFEKIRKLTDAKIILINIFKECGGYSNFDAFRFSIFDILDISSYYFTALDLNRVEADIIPKIKLAYQNKKLMESIEKDPLPANVGRRTKVILDSDFPSDIIKTTEPINISSTEQDNNLKNSEKSCKTFNRKAVGAENCISSSSTSAILFGASTGGPGVLFDILTKLPSDIGVPILVVQHMPANFTKSFADRINKFANLRAVEGEDMLPVRPNTIYIAPGGYHMLVVDDVIRLDSSPTMHGVRPCVDKLFYSCVDNYKKDMIAVILTGMGKDGADGVSKVKSAGGYIIAQEEKSCIVFGMPKAAIETGCVDAVLPQNEIVDEILRVLKKEKTPL